MPTQNQLQMQALDIDAMDWEDLQREVITGDPDVQTPPFRHETRADFEARWCSCGCDCGGC